MMDEEIKALIEREAKEYSERIKKNTNFNSNERIAATAAFKRGASIISEAIINQFRWRKVEEELPDDNRYVLCRKGDYIMALYYNDRNFIDYYNETVIYEIIEWMPIPNN